MTLRSNPLVGATLEVILVHVWTHESVQFYPFQLQEHSLVIREQGHHKTRRYSDVTLRRYGAAAVERPSLHCCAVALTVRKVQIPCLCFVFFVSRLLEGEVSGGELSSHICLRRDEWQLLPLGSSSSLLAYTYLPYAKLISGSICKTIF